MVHAMQKKLKNYSGFTTYFLSELINYIYPQMVPLKKISPYMTMLMGQYKSYGI